MKQITILDEVKRRVKGFPFFANQPNGALVKKNKQNAASYESLKQFSRSKSSSTLKARIMKAQLKRSQFEMEKKSKHYETLKSKEELIKQRWRAQAIQKEKTARAIVFKKILSSFFVLRELFRMAKFCMSWLTVSKTK